jgi:dUTP pyrophosphatase
MMDDICCLAAQVINLLVDKLNAGVIDSGFRNEIFVSLYNGNNYDYVIAKKEVIDDYPYLKDMQSYGHLYPYEKAIAKAILIPIPDVDAEEIAYDQLINITSERGMGMLGSSLK